MSACAYCGGPTHARTQRDRQGRPAHLACTGDHAPSVIEPDADGEVVLAADVAAIEVCEHGHVRLPVWLTGDSTVLPPARLWEALSAP